MDPDRVAQLYRDGVRAIVTITESFDQDAWSRPACGSWNASDTARHLLAVARWYDDWLNLALTGSTSAPFPALQIDEQNDRAVAALQHVDGPTAIACFQQGAVAYLGRALEQWDLAYAYPFGTVTAGLHLGVAATEWHLHAVDLATAIGKQHEPANPSELFRAAGQCVTATKPGVRGAALRMLIPLGARHQPWRTLRRQSGRR